MRPQSCKSKGRRLQQRVASSIVETFPDVLTADDCRSTPMGSPGEDILLSPLARSVVPLSFECKNVERLSIWSCIEQCERNTPPQATPCVVFSKNHASTYACVRWDTLLALLAAAHAARVAQRPPPATENSGEGELPVRVAELVRELASFLPSPPEQD